VPPRAIARGAPLSKRIIDIPGARSRQRRFRSRRPAASGVDNLAAAPPTVWEARGDRPARGPAAVQRCVCRCPLVERVLPVNPPRSCDVLVPPRLAGGQRIIRNSLRPKNSFFGLVARSEPGDSGPRQKGFRQDLERHLAIQPGVRGAVHFAHTALAEFRGDLKMCDMSVDHGTNALLWSLPLRLGKHEFRPRVSAGRIHGCRPCEE
jgi:hypothetical protein